MTSQYNWWDEGIPTEVKIKLCYQAKRVRAWSKGSEVKWVDDLKWRPKRVFVVSDLWEYIAIIYQSLRMSEAKNNRKFWDI